MSKITKVISMVEFSKHVRHGEVNIVKDGIISLENGFDNDGLVRVFDFHDDMDYYVFTSALIRHLVFDYCNFRSLDNFLFSWDTSFRHCTICDSIGGLFMNDSTLHFAYCDLNLRNFPKVHKVTFECCGELKNIDMLKGRCSNIAYKPSIVDEWIMFTDFESFKERYEYNEKILATH